MRKSFVALLAATAMVAATVAVPNPADAQGRRERAFIAGLLFGAAAAALLAPHLRRYAPREGYYYIGWHVAPAPVYCRGGFWAARPLAYDRHGRPTRWSKPRYFCPPPGYWGWHYRHRY